MPSAEAKDAEAGTASDTQDNSPQLNLADTPELWLQKLLEQLQNNDLLTLCRSCRGMRDRVLSLRQVFLNFHLHFQDGESIPAHYKLQLACKLSSNVKLHFDGSYGSYNGCHKESQQDAAALMAALAAASAAGHGLSAITSVELLEMQTKELVPSWLRNCPNLTSLSFVRCPISLPHPATAVPEFGQLKQLTLPTLQHVDGEMFTCWQQQLHGLTGLTSLNITESRSLKDLQCCSVLGSQLTQLSFCFQTRASLASVAALASSFTCLRKLRLPDMVVDDEGMEALLTMQMLTNFECRAFKLQHSYNHRRCRWTHLGLGDMGIDQLDHLPLAGLQSMVVCGECFLYPSNDLSVNLRVTAAMHHLAIKWCHRKIYITNSCISDEYVAAAMPVLATAQADELSIHDRHVTCELLAAMAQHLTRSRFPCVYFDSCTFAPDVWAVFLSSLPPSTAQLELKFRYGDDGITRRDITEACVHACRPVTVRVMYFRLHKSWQKKGLEESWKRVHRAIARAGHQHVKLHICSSR